MNLIKGKTKKGRSKKPNKRRKITIYLRPDELETAQFNRHHRMPRCQGGTNGGDNLVDVDVVSHMVYNMIVSLAGNSVGIKPEQVKTHHQEKVCEAVYRIAERLFVDPVTRVLKPKEQITKEFNEIWLPANDPFLSVFGSRRTLSRMLKNQQS